MSPGCAAAEACLTAASMVPARDDLSRSLDMRLNLLRGRADRIYRFDPFAQQIVEHGVVAALVFSAQNQMNIGRKRLDRLNRRIDICGL